MKTLYLLRHAHTEGSHPDGDHERCLSDQGKAQVQALAPTLTAQNFAPDLVLSSTAQRTRQTVARVQDSGFLPNSQIQFEESFYAASATYLLQTLQGLDAALSSVLFVGHNPGLHQFALALIGSGDTMDLQRISQKFPPCSFVALSFPTDDWAEISLSSGSLTCYAYPELGMTDTAAPGAEQASAPHTS